MSALVFGSPEAQKIIAANKLAEAFAAIDWKNIEKDVDVEEIVSYESALILDGKRFTAVGDTEDDVIDDVINQAKEHFASKFQMLAVPIYKGKT